MIVSQVSSLPGVADGQAGRCRSPGKKGTCPDWCKAFLPARSPDGSWQPPVSHF